MKQGDLVQLSGYGRKREYNNRLTNVDPDQVGIILKVRDNSAYCYKVHWTKLANPNSWIGHIRRELKYAK